MPKVLVLSDLDRTLFDTGKFFDEIWEFAADMYGINADFERSRASEFYKMYGTSYDYHFFDHIRYAVGDEYDQKKFTEAAAHRLSGRYLYPDVTDTVIESLDAILTFGGSEYQLFKILLCPTITHLKTHITLLPKGTYIANTFAKPSVLIDDKPIGSEIVPPAQFILMDRTAKTHSPDELVIRDFSELSVVLARLNID